MSFTELKANVTGTITARSAESGEVVQPGQTIFQVAREDGRDAVFDVPGAGVPRRRRPTRDHHDADRRSVGEGEGARAARSIRRPTR